MNTYERFKEVPHFELVRENQTIIIPSVFMFTSTTELFSFLSACKAFNCTVTFENEDLMITPQCETTTDLRLICYMSIAECREIGNAYIRYLGNLDRMNWDNVKEKRGSAEA